MLKLSWSILIPDTRFARYSANNGKWPHPSEWLKRTDANDWVYYSIAGYHRIFDTLGEYYLPCLSYSSNAIWTYNPFSDPVIKDALTAFERLIPSLQRCRNYRLPTFLYLIQRL